MFFFSLWNPLLQEIYSNFQTCQSYQQSPNFQGKILYSLLWCEKPWLLNISGGLHLPLLFFRSLHGLKVLRMMEKADAELNIQTHTEPSAWPELALGSWFCLVKPNLMGTLWGTLQLLACFPFQQGNSCFFSWGCGFLRAYGRWSPTDTAGISLQKQCWSIWHLSIDWWFAVLLK